MQRHTPYQLLHPFKAKPDRPERAAQDLVAPIGRKDALELQQLRFAVSAGYLVPGTISFVAL